MVVETAAAAEHVNVLVEERNTGWCSSLQKDMVVDTFVAAGAAG